MKLKENDDYPNCKPLNFYEINEKKSDYFINKQILFYHPILSRVKNKYRINTLKTDVYSKNKTRFL